MSPPVSHLIAAVYPPQLYVVLSNPFITAALALLFSMPAFITAGLKRKPASPLLNAQFSIILFHQSLLVPPLFLLSLSFLLRSMRKWMRRISLSIVVSRIFYGLPGGNRRSNYRHRSQTRSNSNKQGGRRRIISNFRVKPRIRRKEGEGSRKGAHIFGRSRAVILKMRLT